MRICTQQIALGIAVSLSVIFLSAGCRKKVEEIQIPTETPTPASAENKTSPAAPVPMQKPCISVTSTDGNIQIGLPDDTWMVMENTEGKYVFGSSGKGSITITRNTEISGIRLPLSKETVLDYLADMGDDTSAMEVEQYELTDIGTDSLKTVTYTVKNSKEGMHPYVIGYLILHTDELYDVTALAEKSDQTLLESLQKSVVSLQVLHEDHPASKVTPVITAPPAAEPADQVQNPEISSSPAGADTQQETARTGQSIMLYNTDTQVRVYELTNGEWADDSGMNYYAAGAGQWQDANGNTYSFDLTTQDSPDTENSENSMVLYRSDGSGSVDISQSPDGNWHDSQGIGYYAEGAGQWSYQTGNNYSVDH